MSCEHLESGGAVEVDAGVGHKAHALCPAADLLHTLLACTARQTCLLRARARERGSTILPASRKQNLLMTTNLLTFNIRKPWQVPETYSTELLNSPGGSGRLLPLAGAVSCA